MLVEKVDQFGCFLVKALGDVLVAETRVAHFDKDCAERSNFYALVTCNLLGEFFQLTSEWPLGLGDTLRDLFLVETDIHGSRDVAACCNDRSRGVHDGRMPGRLGRPDRRRRNYCKQYCDSQTHTRQQQIAPRPCMNLGKRNILLLGAGQAGNVNAKELRGRGDCIKPFLLRGALDDLGAIRKARVVCPRGSCKPKTYPSENSP